MKSKPIFQTANPKKPTKWVAVLVGGLLCALVILLWWILNNKKYSDLYELLGIEANRLVNNISTDLRDRIPSLQHLVKRWEFHKGIIEDEFSMDIQAYVSDMPGFQAIVLIDKHYDVRLVIPLAGNEQIQNLNLGFEEKRRVALEKALSKKNQTPTMTMPLNLVQGGKGFQIDFPVFVNDKLDGFVLAIFRAQEWLSYIIDLKKTSLGANSYKIAVLLDDVVIFSQPGWDDTKYNFVRATTEIIDHRLTVQLNPTETFFKLNNTIINEFIALGGILLSLLVAFMIYLAQRATEENWQAQVAKNSLELAISELHQIKNELQYTNTRLTLATQAGQVGIWSWDIISDQLTWNERMYELYGLPPTLVPSFKTWEGSLHPDDAQRTVALIREAVLGKASYNTEFRIVLPSGETRDIRAAASVDKNEEDQARLMTGINWDITELKQKEKALMKSEEQVRLLLNSTGEAIYGLDLQGNCTFANPACAKMLLYNSPEDLLGKNMHQLIHHSYPDGRRMPVAKCKVYRSYQYGEGEHADDEVFWKADGSHFSVEYWSYPQRIDDKICGAVVTFIDITERKRAEEKIKYLATHDALTGLPTLMLARDRLRMAMQGAKRNKTSCAVMFLDFDGFKNVNDTYGHDTGDALLKELAQRLPTCVRKTDTVARIGGDEFLIIITELFAQESISQVAGKIVETIAQPIFLNETKIEVSVSIGIALFPEQGETIDSLIKKADNAMYKVKTTGKNGYAFTEPPVTVEEIKNNNL